MGTCVATPLSALWSEVCSGVQGLSSQKRHGWILKMGWSSLSELQFLHLLDTSILWKDGSIWLRCPAATLGELWVEQVHYKSVRSFTLATVLLS